MGKLSLWLGQGSGTWWARPPPAQPGSGTALRGVEGQGERERRLAEARGEGEERAQGQPRLVHPQSPAAISTGHPPVCSLWGAHTLPQVWPLVGTSGKRSDVTLRAGPLGLSPPSLSPCLPLRPVQTPTVASQSTAPRTGSALYPCPKPFPILPCPTRSNLSHGSAPSDPTPTPTMTLTP